MRILPVSLIGYIPLESDRPSYLEPERHSLREPRYLRSLKSPGDLGDEGEARPMADSVRNKHFPRLAGCLASVAVLSALTACSGASVPSSDAGSASASSPSSGSSSRTASPSPSETSANTALAALAAYNAMWEDIIAVAQTSDFTNPRLATHMTGGVLAHWTELVATNQSRGWVGRGRQIWNAHVTSASPTAVTVSDCLDDSGWVNYLKDGQRAPDSPDGRHASAAEITLQPDGSWRVSEQIIGKLGSC